MDAPVMQIVPNVKKAITTKVIIVVGFIILIVGMGFYLNSIVDLGVFLAVFSELGIEINGPSVLWILTLITLTISTVMLVMSYVNLHNVSYTLYSDRLLYTPPGAVLLNKEPTQYPYSSISGITFKKQGALKPDLIQVALTGQKESYLNIPYIDNPTEAMANLQRIVDQWKAQYYAEFGHEYRMQNIMG